jgi:hypothetical protein
MILLLSISLLHVALFACDGAVSFPDAWPLADQRTACHADMIRLERVSYPTGATAMPYGSDFSPVHQKANSNPENPVFSS